MKWNATVWEVYNNWGDCPHCIAVEILHFKKDPSNSLAGEQGVQWVVRWVAQWVENGFPDGLRDRRLNYRD